MVQVQNLLHKSAVLPLRIYLLHVQLIMYVCTHVLLYVLAVPTAGTG